MTDDIDYLRARIPDYQQYDQEHARHDSDMRVRAFVGERVSEAQTRFGESLDAGARTAVDEVLMRCMFTDQTFTRKFEHAVLAPPMLEALVHADRKLVELAESLPTATLPEFASILRAIDAQFEYRRAPLPA